MTSASANERQEAKIRQRIKLSLESGDYYEAHQRYRALHFRLVSQNRIDEALALVFDGARELFEKQQIDSGTDLSMLYVAILTDHKASITKESINRIGFLHGKIRHDHPDRVNFVNGSVKWSSDACKRHRHARNTSGVSTQREPSDGLVGHDLSFICKYGHPDIHRMFAMNLWNEKNYAESRHHFLLSNDGESCGSMLVEFQRSVGFSTEVDLFIAQVVFHYLCMKRIPVAKSTFKSYATQHPDILSSNVPFAYPLLNFLYFLILALEQSKLQLYTVLCEQYAVVLRRDPIFYKHLDRIGQLFFGLPPAEGQQRNAQPGGFLGGLMSTIFSSMSEPNDDEEDYSDEDGADEHFEVPSDQLPQRPGAPNDLD